MIDRLEMAAKLSENQDPVRQFAISQSLDSLRKAGVVDPGWPENGGRPTDGSDSLTRNFSKGALKDLERNHAVVFDPLETSLDQMKKTGRPFWYIICQNDERFMNLESIATQAAIFPEPKRFYIPESNNLSLRDQEELVKVDQREVLEAKMGIGGTLEVIDNVATNAGLVFAYYDKTKGRFGGGVRLHGRDYGYRYTRTNTPTVESFVAGVGYFVGRDGLDVSGWFAGRGRPNVWVSRLVVPAQE